MKEETLTERGIRLAKKGKMDEARKVFQLVIDETPDDASAWCNYATTYFKIVNLVRVQVLQK